MRGYGRDYDDRNWLGRAEDTVRGWFGGGREYGWSGADRNPPTRGDWSRGPDRAPPGEGYRTNNWNNQHSNWDTVNRAGSYYGMGYQDRPTPYRPGPGYDRDFGSESHHGWERGRMQGGMGRGMTGGPMGGRDTRGGSMPDRGMPDRGMRGSGQRDPWMEYEADGGGSYGGHTGWGDYDRGGYGGGRWRNSTSGGVEPGRYFRGYGNGSTGGSGYEPY